MTKQLSHRILCQDIQPDSEQPRLHFTTDSISALSISLISHGQLVPIIVRRENDHIVLVDGERRWRAAQLAQMESLDAIILDNKPDAADLKVMQLTINSQREDLNPLEKAKALQAIMELKTWNAKQLSEAIGMNNSAITILLALPGLPLSIQMLIEQGKLDVSKAYYISRIDDKEEQEKLALLAAEGRITRDALAKRTAKTKSSKAISQTSTNAKRLAFALPDGYCISLTGFDLSLNKIASLLSDLSKHARRAQAQGLESTTLARQLSDQNKATLAS